MESIPWLRQRNIWSLRRSGQSERQLVDHMLHWHDRRFHDLDFLFCAYWRQMRQRFRGLSIVAAKHTKRSLHEEIITPGELANAIKVLSKNSSHELSPQQYVIAMRLVNRMQPYALRLPGTPLFYKRHRRQLYASLASGRVKPTWFHTYASNSLYWPEVYKIR
jgi:hypothetical protein